MALPCLPAEHIEPAFKALVDTVPDRMTSSRRPRIVARDVRPGHVDHQPVVASQCLVGVQVFAQNKQRRRRLAQNRLNRKTRNGKLDVYQLAPVLHDEALYVGLQSVLVEENRLRRYQRRTYRQTQGQLHDYWQRYSSGDMTSSELLRKCAHVIAPCM